MTDIIKEVYSKKHFNLIYETKQIKAYIQDITFILGCILWMTSVIRILFFSSVVEVLFPLLISYILLGISVICVLISMLEKK